jgi:cytochrome c peroxidase
VRRLAELHREHAAAGDAVAASAGAAEGAAVTRSIIAVAIALVACGKSSDKQHPGHESGSAKPTTMRPPSMPPLVLTSDAKRKEKIELGHVLFFDKRLSANNDRSCYSCHQNEDGNGGHDPIAIGSGDKKQTRHAPVIWNVAYYDNALYWDGRAKDLEANAKGAWAKGNMGVGDDKLDAKAAELGAIPGYKKLFDAAFPGEPITPDHVVNAIAEYERTLLCNDTAYDNWAAGDATAVTEQQQRGFNVFMGKAVCVTCHAPPMFSTAMMTPGGMYFNVGIGTKGISMDLVDIGREKITNKEADWAAFKPPSLRNVTRSAPYMHDGSIAKLEDAVKLMSSGGIDNKNKSAAMVDHRLTDDERADIVAFLGALACPGKLEPPAAMP